MMKVNKNAKVQIHWRVSPYDYSPEMENNIIAKASKKYGIPKDKIKVLPNYIMLDESGKKISLTNDVIQNIQNPSFQVELFKKYLNINKINGYDFDLIRKIDADINTNIDYNVYDKYRRYSVKWIRWSNFLSYGEDNYFDFTSMKDFVLLNGEPANQSGKTTFAIDLLHFLLFGKTEKVPTQNLIFNKHLSKETNVVVEGCLNIDGEDYVIKRTLSRPALEKRTAKSKVTQKVYYYRIIGTNKEELTEYVDNEQEENSIQTNKAIKEAIGREDDFDLIISVTESNLDDLIKKKETERGRLLSRWIGLLPLEEKDRLAREKFNSDIKPFLLSNRYNRETLKLECDAFDLEIKNLTSKNKEIKNANKKVEEEIENLEKSKNNLLQSKQSIDTNLINVDIITLKYQLEEITKKGKEKKSNLVEIENEIKSIGEIEFSINEYDELIEKRTNEISQKGIISEQYKNIKHNIEHLQKSEFCPTCGKKFDNVDNSAKIKELQEEERIIIEKGKKSAALIEEYNTKIESLKTKRDLYNKRNELNVKKSAIEVNLSNLRSDLIEKKNILDNYNKNSEAIDKNNKLDIEIRNTEQHIKAKRQEKENNNWQITSNEATIKRDSDEIVQRKNLIKQLEEEDINLRNWKIYLQLVGKDGISKMVLRDVLPIINAKINMLLSDVCDFDVIVEINEKNDINFCMIKDNVKSDLASGSGFEKTASSMALRAVLGSLSTMPKPNFIVLDEVYGRVAKENLENIHKLINKVCEDYDFVITVSHLEIVKDWANTTITVVKENNVSRLSVTSSTK